MAVNGKHLPSHVSFKASRPLPGHSVLSLTLMILESPGVCLQWGGLQQG